MTREMVRDALQDLVMLVDERLPERFYAGEGFARPAMTALIGRIAGIGESIALIASRARTADTLILLRALYEHVLTLCWIAIDPEERTLLWREHAIVLRKKLHNDVAAFGVSLLSDAELAEAAGLQQIPGLIERADEADRFWSERIAGFRPQPASGHKSLLTLRGIYTGVYRPASRLAHAQMEAIDDCIDLTRYPRHPAVVSMEVDDDLTWAALAVPLTAMALLVCNYRLGWPEGEVVRVINDGLMRGT